MLYGQCAEPLGISTVEQLQEYLLRFSSVLDGASPEAEAAKSAHQALAHTIRNATLLPSKEADIARLTDKLTGVHQKFLEAESKAKTADGQKVQLESLTNQVKALEKEKTELQEAKQQKEQLEKEKAELLQKQQQLEKEKQELEQKLQQAGGSSSSSSSSSGNGTASETELNAAKMRALAVAGDMCYTTQDYEFWSDPILVWGYEHRAVDAAECCASCHAQRRLLERGGTAEGRNGSACNTWAFCGDRAKCKERFGECWLKRNKQLNETRPPELPKGASKSEGWISGAVYENDTHLQQFSGHELVFHTKHGDIAMALLPDLAPNSVAELRRAALMLAPYNGYCQNCRIYRPEKNFLVQGVIEAPGVYPAVPRHPSPPQKMVMEKGLVCWAGGSGGPHWFVNMIDQSGFKDDHLCFAKASNASMAVFDKILELPMKNKTKPSDMNGLLEPIFYNMTLRKPQR
uniref:PPIase cyclophilin-type domain-containing protein n=1 Tax=Tetradesmus obliquus TaxID=3088 RepID=A0A383VDC9_TETOB|eukprot:jgi/Sobl393_1/15179/SZX63191.1